MRIVLLGALFFAFSLYSVAQDGVERINGFNVMPAFNPFSEDYTPDIVETGAEWVSLVTYIYSDLDQPILGYKDRPQKWGETIQGLEEMIGKARAAGIKVMLKPSVWIPGFGWPGEMSFRKDGWEIWEEKYSAYIIGLAKLAEERGVEMLCIGTELKQSVRYRPEFWEKLIADIRCVYEGKLTYSSNWDNYGSVGFWSQLDYMGINAYFPLSNKKTPNKEELSRAWQPVVRHLQNASEKTGRPVIFTEYGYRSIDVACGRQWLIEHIRNGEAPANFETQIAGYESIFETFWNQDWFAGGFIWHWKVEGWDYNWETDNGYSPKDKPVIEVLQKYFQPVLQTDQ